MLDIDIHNNEANSGLDSIKQREKAQYAERKNYFPIQTIEVLKKFSILLIFSMKLKNNVLKVFYVVNLGIIAILIPLFHVLKKMPVNIHQLMLVLRGKVDY